MGMLATSVMSLFPKFNKQSEVDESAFHSASASAPCVRVAESTSLFRSPTQHERQRRSLRAPHTVGVSLRAGARPGLPHSRSNGSVNMKPELTPMRVPFSVHSAPMDMDSSTDHVEEEFSGGRTLGGSSVATMQPDELIPFGAQEAHEPKVFAPQRLFSPAPTTQVRAVPKGLFSPPRATPPPTPTGPRRQATLRIESEPVDATARSQATLHQPTSAPTLMVNGNDDRQDRSVLTPCLAHKRPPSRTPVSARRLRLSQEDENMDASENAPMPDALELTSVSSSTKSRRTIAPKNLMTEFDTLESLTSKPFATGPHNSRAQRHARRKSRF
jgi:hypothetical protein